MLCSTSTSKISCACAGHVLDTHPTLTLLNMCWTFLKCVLNLITYYKCTSHILLGHMPMAQKNMEMMQKYIDDKHLNEDIAL